VNINYVDNAVETNVI